MPVAMISAKPGLTDKSKSKWVSPSLVNNFYSFYPFEMNISILSSLC